MVFSGGVHGFFGGCVIHGFWGGMHGFFGGCMVFSGGRVVFFSFSECIGYNEIRSMSGRYASYWNAFLFKLISFRYHLVSGCTGLMVL